VLSFSRRTRTPTYAAFAASRSLTGLANDSLAFQRARELHVLASRVLLAFASPILHMLSAAFSFIISESAHAGAVMAVDRCRRLCSQSPSSAPLSSCLLSSLVSSLSFSVPLAPCLLSLPPPPPLLSSLSTISSVDFVRFSSGQRTQHSRSILCRLLRQKSRQQEFCCSFYVRRPSIAS
jgi:hypothetical protein